MRLLVFLFLVVISFRLQADPFIRFEENGKVGLKNESGVVVIPALYEALGWSNGNFSIKGGVTGYKLKGSWGVVKTNNERITPAEYSSLVIGEGSLLVASKQSASMKVTTGCIGTDGKIIIPFIYTGVTAIHSLRVVAFVREGNLFKHGLIDLENKVLIPFEYQNIYPIGSLRYAVENFQGKTALFSEGGQQISDFTIDSLSAFVNNLAIIYESDKKGIINREGQLISEPRYRDIKIESNRVLARLPDEWHILKSDNTIQKVIEADSIISLGEKRFKIVSAGVVKLADEHFQFLQKENFSDIDSFQNGRAVFKSGGKYGVMKRNEEKILDASFDKIILDEDYLLTSERKIDRIEWSLRDTLGQRKNSKSYDLLLCKQGSVFPALKNGYWGAINNSGNEVIACVYDTILEINNNQLAVKFKGQYGIISLKEEWLAYPQPHRVKLLNADRFWRQVDNTLFLCSFTGNVFYFTINPIEVKEDHFIEQVQNGGAWIIDFDGRIINRQLAPTEPTEEIFKETEGLRGIRKNGKYGFIDDQGRLRIANRYEGIMPFNEGLAAIKIRNKWGFINRDEKIAIQPVYETVTLFEKGFSKVKQKGLYGLIDKEGKLLIPMRYSQLHLQSNGRIKLEMGDKQGLADQQGNVLLFPKYEWIEDLNNGYVIVKLNEKYGLTTLQGLSTIPALYDFLSFDVEKDRFLALKKSEWTILEK